MATVGRARPPDSRGRARPERRIWTQCPGLSGGTVTSGCVAGHGGMGPGGRCASPAREPRGEPAGLGRSCGGARAAVVRLGTWGRAEALPCSHSFSPAYCIAPGVLGGTGLRRIRRQFHQQSRYRGPGKGCLSTEKHWSHGPESRRWSWALGMSLYSTN